MKFNLKIIFLCCLSIPLVTMEKPYKENELNTKIYRQEEIIIAGQEIGHALYVQTESTTWHLSWFFVDQLYRKQGYGKLLLKKCYDFIKSQNGKQITIDVLAIEDITNKDLINFYKKSFYDFDPKNIVIIDQENIFPSQRLTLKLSSNT